MLDFFMGIEFEYPLVFLVLILYFICVRWCRAKNIAIYFPNIPMLKRATGKKSSLLELLKFLSVFSLVVALASPIKEDTVETKKDKGYEIALILDASGSMEEYGKFDIVKKIVMDFIDKRKHDKLALTIFADFAYVAVPLTYDKDSLKQLLERISVGVAGKQRTALYEALFLSVNLFKTSKAKEKIAILLTDGMDNANTIPLEVAIKRAKKYGIKVYTIGVGRDGVDFNSAVLKKIAKETGGKYFNGNSIQKLQEIYETINRLEKSEITANKYIKKTYYYQYILMLSLLSLVLLFHLKNVERE